jgi:bifunctional DNase/RNase
VADGLQSIDDDDLVLLSVTDVRVAVPAGNGVEAGLVVLEEVAEPHRQLRMYVGQPEARAIHASWSQTVPPRPSTWDLFISTISLLDARVDRAVINDVEEERHYFAQLVIDRAEVDDPLRLTARPSDAIALALRGYGAKLYARPHVLDEAGLLADGSHWVRPQPEPVPLEPEGPDEAVAADLEPEIDPDPGRDDADDEEPGMSERPEQDPILASEVSPGPPAEDRRAAAADRAAAARSARSFRGGAPS